MTGSDARAGTAAPGADAEALRLARVAPADWMNPAPAPRYDLVVLGGGTAGLVSALGAAGLGAKVALVEQRALGGDCLNTGCVPSKALLAAARVAATCRGAGAYGVKTGAVTVDFAEVMARMRRLRADVARHDAATRVADAGVDLFLGAARFTGRDTVAVGGASLRFRRAALCTGARPALPKVPGLAEAAPFTSDTVFGLDALPARLAVIGAGPIGVELAQAFARFGSAVTLLEAAARILPREDPDAAAAVAAALAADGVPVRPGARLARAARDGDRWRLDLGGQALEVDAVLVATGRRPNLEDLSLEAAGIRVDAGRLVVDDRLRTTNRRVYAAGDVVVGAGLTHLSDAHARLLVRNALFPGSRRVSALGVPRVIYTAPEVAQVGLTAAEAEARGIAVDTFTEPFAELDRAMLEGDTGGLARVHLARGTDRILGATLVGAHAGETIAEVATAMQHDLGLSGLGAVVHPYPTEAEALRRLADARARTRLTPRVARWLARYLAWGR